MQRQALRPAGCGVIRTEKASGTRRDRRTELQVLLDFVQPGDTVVVTRIDRLARSLKDLQDIVHELKGRGVALRATEQPVDTGTAAGKAFLDMRGVFAEFETNLRRERQLEGMKQAKARGVYGGRKPSIDMAEIRRLREQDGLGTDRDCSPARYWACLRLASSGSSMMPGEYRRADRGARDAPPPTGRADRPSSATRNSAVVNRRALRDQLRDAVPSAARRAAPTRRASR